MLSLLLILDMRNEKSKSESQEQKSGTASLGKREQDKDQVSHAAPADARKTADSKISTPKTKTRRRIGKQLSVCVSWVVCFNFHEKLKNHDTLVLFFFLGQTIKFPKTEKWQSFSL